MIPLLYYFAFIFGIAFKLSLCNAGQNSFVTIEIFSSNLPPNSKNSIKMRAMSASFGLPVPLYSNDLNTQTLIQADPITGCESLKNQPRFEKNGIALFVRRGGCTFQDKLLIGHRFGASLIIVGDDADAIYSSNLTDSEKFNCDNGNGYSTEKISPSGSIDTSTESCAFNSKCTSEMCILTGQHTNDGYQVCCINSPLVVMGPDNNTLVNTQGVFINLKQSKEIQSLMLNGKMSIRAFQQNDSPWNIAMFLLWILAVVVLVLSSYCSAKRERLFSRQIVVSKYCFGGLVSQKSSYKTIGDIDNSSPIHLSAWHGLLFLLTGSAMLLTLYFVHILLIVNIIFAISGSLAFNTVIMSSLFESFPPFHSTNGLRTPMWFISINSIISFFLSFTLGIWWFVQRNDLDMWIIQDLFGICLCVLFTDIIQIPSLKVASIFLSLAFIYDVFFVYLSPYVFGSNVMVAVASGSGKVKIHMKDLCLLHPEAEQCGGGHEIMPLLLRMPLLFSLFNGEAMLGLGDIILPSLLTSFLVRFDYCKGNPISRHYFMISSLAYAIGLLLANIMAVLLRHIVSGQPALMYIVPIMLGTVIGVSWYKGDLNELWSGPDCMTLSESKDIKQPLIDSEDKYIK